MANFISSIEGLKIHDASAIHDISANKRSYTVNIGNAGSALSTSKQIDIPSDVNTILNNLTTNLILKDVSVTPDIDVYNKVQVDYELNIVKTRQTTVENGVGDIPEYDPYLTYFQDSLAKHNGFYWRCMVTTITGPWDEQYWHKTSVLEEIEAIRGTLTNIEKCTVVVGVNRGDGIVAGTTITLMYDSSTGKEPLTAILDSTGQATFFITIGDKYFIKGSGMVGYMSPESPVYEASMPKRTLYLQYKIYGTGIYIIDNNGLETDVQDWDTTRTDGRFVRFTNDALCPQGTGIDNSLVISKAWNSYLIQKRWQAENRSINSIPYGGSDRNNPTLANSLFNGYSDSTNAYKECTTPNAAGKTYVDLYNDSKGTSITIEDYLPAICAALQVKETINGRTVDGYLPAMGQLRMLCDNKNAINNALTMIGGTAISINTGVWQSTTQVPGGAWVWRLNGGRTEFYFGGNGKTTDWDNVLVLFHI